MVSHTVIPPVAPVGFGYLGPVFTIFRPDYDGTGQVRPASNIVMKRAFLVIGAASSLVMVYLAGIWHERRAAGQRLEAVIAERHTRVGGIRAEDRDSGLRIVQFYAASAEVVDGDRNLVCYGVRNAAAVRIEPAVEQLSPALSRCFWTEPRSDTAYRLVATGSDGREISESFQVRVVPAPPRIVFMAVSDKQIKRGDPVTMCYGVTHAAAARIDPIGWTLAPIAKNCVRFYPKATLQYMLVATGDAGRTDTEKFTVQVR